MRRLLVFAAVLGALLGAVAGCGGNDDEASGATSAEQWADAFCTSVTTWTDELEQVGQRVGDPASLDVDGLEQAVGDALDATERLIEEIRALGRPDTESGEEVEQAIETLADTVESERENVETALGDVSDITDLPGAITAIGAGLTAMGTGFGQAVDALENADVDGELEAAFDNSEACDPITD